MSPAVPSPSTAPAPLDACKAAYRYLALQDPAVSHDEALEAVRAALSHHLPGYFDWVREVEELAALVELDAERKFVP